MADAKPWELSYDQPKPWEFDYSQDEGMHIAAGEKPLEQPGTLEGITTIANLPFDWAARNLFSKIEKAPGEKFGLTTRPLTQQESEKSFLGFDPNEIPSGENTTMPGITVPISSAVKTGTGIAQFLTSPKGITEMISAVSPARAITYAKWFTDMGAGALKSIPEAWNAYRRGDIQGMSDALVNAGAMSLGAAGLGREMFKKEPPPPTPNRGLMIEERSRSTPPKYAVDPLGQTVDISELSEAEKRELFRGPKEYVPREEYVRPAQAEPPVIGGLDPTLTPERIQKILARLNPPAQLIPGVERGTLKRGEGGAASFASPAEGGGIPSARQTGVEPTEFTAGTGAEQPPDLIQDVTQAVMSKDRTGLQEMRNQLQGFNPEKPKQVIPQAPGVGTVSQANDVLRLIDERLKELTTDKINPELERIRRTIIGRKPIDIPATVEVLPQERKQLAEPQTRQLGEGQKLLPAPPTEPPKQTETPNASENEKAAEVHGDLRPQPEQGAGQVPTEESRTGIQPSGPEETARQVPLKAEQQQLLDVPVKAKPYGEPEMLEEASQQLPDYEEEFNRAWSKPADEKFIADSARDAAADPDYEAVRTKASWRYAKDPRAFNFPKVINSFLDEIQSWFNKKRSERTKEEQKAMSYLVANHPELIHQAFLRRINQRTSLLKPEERAMEFKKAYALEKLNKLGLTDYGDLALSDWKDNREMVWMAKPGLAAWIEKNIFPNQPHEFIMEPNVEGQEQMQSRLPPEQRGSAGGNLSTFGFFDPANYRPAITFGRELAGKVTDFAKWSAEMVKKFGDSIKDSLDDIWGFIKSGVDDAKGASGRLQSVLDMSGDDFSKFAAPEGNRGLTEKAYELGNEVRNADSLEEAKTKATEQAKEAKRKMMEAAAADKPKLLNDALAFSNKRQFFDEAAKMARALERVAKGESVADVAKDVGVTDKWLKQYSEQKPVEARGPGGGNLSTFGWIDPAAWLKDLDNLRKGFGTIFNAMDNRLQMDAKLDAADNRANILGQRMGNRVRAGKVTPQQDVAASAIIAAKFNPRNLPDLLRKAIAGGNKEAEEGIRLAMSDWQTIEPIAQRGHAIMDGQQASEVRRGVNTQYREGYLPGVYDMDLLMGTGRPFVIAGTRGGGIASGFKKGKTYASPFDAIEDGYTPRSLKLSDLVEHRVRAGQRLINRIAWGDAFRNVTDPTDGKPIITSPVKHARGPGLPGYESVPMGYVPREIIPGVRLAVHESYSKLFDALTGRSVIEDFEVKGIPVGSIALGTAGGIKHGLLLFDSFHASRIMQKQLFLQGKISYNKGRTVLEYSDRDLNQAVRDGDITQEMADYARANRGKSDLLIRNGLNVGRVQEALYTQAIRNIPGIGRANKWIFEKLTRGAMMESGISEFDRISAANPQWTPEQVARKVSRDLNVYYGNIGRQGIFKSKTMQDLARMAFLAPQWVESVVRSEIGGVKQLAIDPLINKKLAVGSLGSGMAKGLIWYLLGTQIGNLITTGLATGKPRPTWQNEDKGHKLDMWVPDVTGKTRGFYISPLSIVAETTHDIIRSMKTEPDVLSAVGRVLANKAAPMWRAGKVLLQGKDWSGQQVNGVWNKAKHAAIDLLPAPIPASTILKGGSPGSTQRLMMQSAGLKAEPAGSVRSQVIDRAKSWGEGNKNPKVAREYDRRSKTTYPESEYKPLREALTRNDRTKVVDSVKELLSVDQTLDAKQKHMKQILREFQPFTEKDIKPFATRSREMEIPFVRSLDAAGKKAYVQAVREQIKDYRKLTRALYGREMNPPIPSQYQKVFAE